MAQMHCPACLVDWLVATDGACCWVCAFPGLPGGLPPVWRPVEDADARIAEINRRCEGPLFR